MKNEITHPLERYKRIADPTIRQQCIDNFDEEFYRLRLAEGNKDNGTICDAIEYGFDWEINLEDFDYWSDIFGQALNGTLPLLPEPIEEPLNEPTNEPKLIVGANTYSTVLEMMVEELKQKNDQLRSENEKLRECLAYYYDNARFSNYSVEEHLTASYQAKQLLNK